MEASDTTDRATTSDIWLLLRRDLDNKQQDNRQTERQLEFIAHVIISIHDLNPTHTVSVLFHSTYSSVSSPHLIAWPTDCEKLENMNLEEPPTSLFQVFRINIAMHRKKIMLKTATPKGPNIDATDCPTIPKGSQRKKCKSIRYQ